MGHLKLINGKLVKEGYSPYYLPAVISREFVLELLNVERDSEFFIGELAKHFVFSDKRRLAHTCKQLGNDVFALYRQHAYKWAAVINEDNKWRLEDFTSVYEARIDTGWVDRIVITKSGTRFCVTADKILTFAEFQWVYGQTILDHLDSKKQQELDRLEQVKKMIQSELISLRLCVVDSAGLVHTKEYIGLEDQDPRDWRLPDGMTFLAVDQPCSAT